VNAPLAFREYRMKAIAIGVIAGLSLIGVDHMLSGGRYTHHAHQMAQSMAHGFGIR
jgi:hypothetical protein